MNLKGKKIIVTGGAGGIGSALVQELLGKGAIVAVFDNHVGRLDSLCENLPLGGQQSVLPYHIDIGNFEAVESSVGNFFEHHGKIDALVNNAAVLTDGCLLSIYEGKLLKYSLAEWQKTIDTNLNGAFYCTREVVEKMVQKRTKGVVINVSSISAAGNLGQTGYAASKAALNTLTVTWAQELALFGIRVAGVSPGMTNTTMPRQAMGDSLLGNWIGKTPLKRMAMPHEIAHGIMFALENDFFCGRVLELDGGLRM